MSNIIITNSRLGGKRGVLKTFPGSDNLAVYHEVVVGAFNVMSEKSEFYDFTNSVKSLFDRNNSLFMRMVLSGRLRGEIEHPYPVAGQSAEAFFNRVRQIRNDLTSHQFRNIRLEDGKDDKGNNIVLVIAEVTGSGPYMDATNARLNNRDENIDFSGRFFTTSKINAGVIHKQVNFIATYDQVNMGGIGVANKYSTPSMESIYGGEDNDIIVNLDKVKDPVLPLCVGMESNILFSTTMIKDACGWNRVELISPRSSLNW
jgi:hypothetical protein